jgi:NADH-quinone oxidoreductase subunit E
MDRYQGNTEIRPIGTLESTATCAGIAGLAGAGTFFLLLLIGDWSPLQAIFGGGVVAAVLLPVLALTIGRPQSEPRGGIDPTADLAQADQPGTPGEAARPLAPRHLNAPSPHKESIDFSPVSDTRTQPYNDPTVNKAISPGPGGTPMAEAAPATRIPAPAPINAEDAGVARPVGATTDPVPMAQPAPLQGRVISPEPPEPIDPERAAAGTVTRNEAGETGAPRPAPTATTEAQSYNEVEPVPATPTGTAAAAASTGGAATEDTARVNERVGAETVGGPAVSGDDVPEGEEVKPETIAAPRVEGGDDLKKIKGVGPKLETLCNEMGFWHYDQIAAWGPKEVAWVDRNLVGFRGRVTRDDWVGQARILADGGQTEFSSRSG